MSMLTPAGINKFIRSTFSSVLLLSCTLPALASNYAEHPQAQRLIQQLSQESQFNPDELSELFAQAQRKDNILAAIARPAEKTKAWHQYRKIFIHDKNIQAGKQFINKHLEDLQRAEATYGVPKEIITAILGVETRYGTNQGSFRVIDALATLGFDYPPRAKFFRGQLKEFLLMTREQGFDPLSLKGSYAGAMGYGQFIPSSYRAYAVDFDNDQVADIWQNPSDAIGSVANYFAKHRWQTGKPVAQQVEVDAKQIENHLSSKLKPQKTLAEWRQQGLQAKPADAAQKAILIKLEGEQGPEYWLGFANFYVITRYNRSRLYAMAVYQLSQALASNEP